MAESTEKLDQLFARVAGILQQARGAVARTINTAMVQAYWQIGREIVEDEQAGERRAGYGDELLKRLSKRLSKQFGAGFGVSNLKDIRRFYLVFPGGSKIGQTPSGLLETSQTASGLSVAAFPHALSWSHYVTLMRVRDDRARGFYEIEAAREAWSVRELER